VFVFFIIFFTIRDEITEQVSPEEEVKQKRIHVLRDQYRYATEEEILEEIDVIERRRITNEKLTANRKLLEDLDLQDLIREHNTEKYEIATKVKEFYANEVEADVEDNKEEGKEEEIKLPKGLEKNDDYIPEDENPNIIYNLDQNKPEEESKSYEQHRNVITENLNASQIPAEGDVQEPHSSVAVTSFKRKAKCEEFEENNIVVKKKSTKKKLSKIKIGKSILESESKVNSLNYNDFNAQRGFSSEVMDPRSISKTTKNKVIHNVFVYDQIPGDNIKKDENIIVEAVEDVKDTLHDHVDKSMVEKAKEDGKFKH